MLGALVALYSKFKKANTLAELLVTACYKEIHKKLRAYFVI